MKFPGGISIGWLRPNSGGMPTTKQPSTTLNPPQSTVPPKTPSSISSSQPTKPLSNSTGVPVNYASLRSKVTGQGTPTSPLNPGIWDKLKSRPVAFIGGSGITFIAGSGIIATTASLSGTKDPKSPSASPGGANVPNTAAMEAAGKLLQDRGILKSLALNSTLSPEQKSAEAQRIGELASRQVTPNDVKQSLIVLGAQYRLISGQMPENVTESRNLSVGELLGAAPQVEAKLTELQKKEKSGGLSEDEKSALTALQVFKSTAQKAGLNLGMKSWNTGKAALPDKQKAIVAREVALEKIAAGQLDPAGVKELNSAGRPYGELSWKDIIDSAVISINNEFRNAS
jgi:hypothetical protein